MDAHHTACSGSMAYDMTTSKQRKLARYDF
jgi:hypothetical protein